MNTILQDYNKRLATCQALILLKGHRRKTSEGRENSFAAFGALADGFVQDFPDCAGQWFLIHRA